MWEYIPHPIPRYASTMLLDDVSGNRGDIQNKMDATKTLPASWYCSQNLYHLEQRAVFHKAWYFVGAVPRFADEREVEYEFAGVAITVHHDGEENFTITRNSDVGSTATCGNLPA